MVLFLDQIAQTILDPPAVKIQKLIFKVRRKKLAFNATGHLITNKNMFRESVHLVAVGLVVYMQISDSNWTIQVSSLSRTVPAKMGIKLKKTYLASREIQDSSPAGTSPYTFYNYLFPSK